MKFKKLINRLYYLIPFFCSGLFFFGLDRYSLWYDELQTWATVSKSTFGQFWSYSLDMQAGPPIYYFVLWLLNPFLNWSEFNLRIVSAICASGMLFSFFYLIKRNTNTLLAFSFCLLCSTNEKIIYYAQEARPYAMLMLFISLSLVVFFNLLEHKNEFKKRMGHLLLINFFVLYTHYYGAVFVAAELLMLCFLLKVSVKEKLTLVFFHLIELLPVVYFFASRDIVRNFSFLTTLSPDSLDLAIPIFSNSRKNIVFFFGLVIVAVLKMREKKISRHHKFLYCLLGIIFLNYVFVFFAGTIKHIFLSRYLIYTVPIIYMCIIMIVLDFSKKLFEALNNELYKKNLSICLTTGIAIYFSYFQWLQSENILEITAIRKQFPIKEAYQVIQKDILNTDKNSFVLLNDVSILSYEYYGKEIAKSNLVDISCHDCSVNDKSDWIELLLNSDISSTYYFINITYKNFEEAALYLRNKNFNKKIIFNSGRVLVVKYALK